MNDPTTNIGRCTAQKRNGAFCDLRSAPDMPFPICAKHASILLDHMGGSLHYPDLRRVVGPDPMAPKTVASAEFDAYTERRAQRQKDQTQVYYVRIGDRVKIGYTVNMKQRMVALRVPIDNVLATEPGGRETELQRHAMFKEERHGRLEEFNPSRRLLAHIDTVKAEHGEPNITGYANGAA